MKKELDDLLCATYPKIFAERQKEESLMFFGFTCGDGWFNPIDGLCAYLQSLTDERGAPQVVATQVKEKFGQLRFYVKYITTENGGLDITEKQRAAIEFAEFMSARTCDVCGKRGEIIKGGMPIVTRCKEHTDPVLLVNLHREEMRRIIAERKGGANPRVCFSKPYTGPNGENEIEILLTDYSDGLSLLDIGGMMGGLSDLTGVYVNVTTVISDPRQISGGERAIQHIQYMLDNSEPL
jgi:hypothetical protein